MKKLQLFLVVIFNFSTVWSQNIGIGTTTPNASAILDITHSNKGLLPPRIALTGITDVSTITAPATGLLVYNTATAGVAPNNVVPGYYYYTGVNWYRLNNQGTHPGDILYWNGTQWAVLAAGSNGEALRICNGLPVWGACLPELTTTAATNIGTTSAIGGGTVTSNGGGTIIELGVCYDTIPGPTIADEKTSAAVVQTSFSAFINNLNSGTTYYVRAYATNSAGTAYGNEINFTTATTPGIALPVLTTTTASSITQVSASSGLTINNTGGGNISVKGICFSTSPNPTLSDTVRVVMGTGSSFVIAMTALTPATTYYIRAFATNAAGTGYGNQVSFSTLPVTIPVLTTTAISNISFNSATSGGTITNTGGGNISAKGICYSTSPNATIANNVVTSPGNSPYMTSMTGLNNNTTYFVRAFATNSAGTGYGNEIAFTTSAPLAFNATYTFSSVNIGDADDDTPPPVVQGVSFGSFSANGVGDPGNQGSTASGRFAFVNWPPGTNLSVSTLDLSRYYEVTITPLGKLDLSKITFTFQRTASGVRQAAIRSSADGFIANLPAAIDPANAALSVAGNNIFQITDNTNAQDGCTITLGPGFTNLTTNIRFRFYGFNSESAVSDTFSIDNVVFSGVSH